MGRKSNKKDSWFIQLDTTNQYVEKTVQNVLATIRGFMYPRQTIMLGASRTRLEPVPPNEATQTETLLTLALPLRDMLQGNKWLPKRSITFSFWGGAEFGDIGRTEYFEQNGPSQEEVITYIDLDEAREVPKSGISMVVPALFHDLLSSVVKGRASAMLDEQAYSYSYEEDSDIGSGSDFFDKAIDAFKEIQFIDPDDLPSTQWTSIPLIQMKYHQWNSATDMSEMLQWEIARLQALLMLRLADQNVIMYDNVATVKSIKADVKRIVFSSHSLPENIIDALEGQASTLSNNTAIFDHVIDNQIDHSDFDFVAAVNTVLIQFNKLLAQVKQQIKTLMTKLPDRRPADDLELTDDLSAILPNLNEEMLREYSSLIVTMHNANDLLKTVHFQILSNDSGFGGNDTDSMEVSDEDYSDLERGWV